ncbi:hypothetical protein NUW58_g8273 [Xylaria curta]|uniref:Uncharacterized protein n=1 Tax=Xylaria curta TaxID=42375 RepID=A0ACC1N9S9_9PEZI|nr:hypothetical protein NUW58_g8273 [Xylaria curta]
MDARRPRPDWEIEDRWHWPAWRFGMRLDELFTTLHEKFNMWPAPILDFEAFHHDVAELAHTAKTKDELFRALELRKKQRCEEITEVWELIAGYGTAGASILPEEHWAYAVQFFRTRSLDAMIAFLFEFLVDEEKEEVIRLKDFRRDEDRVPTASDGVEPNAVVSSREEQAPEGQNGGECDREDREYGRGWFPLLDQLSSIPRPIHPRWSKPDPYEELLTERRMRRKKRKSRPVGADPNPGQVTPESPKSRNMVSKPGPRRPPRHNAKERSTKDSTTGSRYNLRPRASRKAT